jgi:hypothetical protein
MDREAAAALGAEDHWFALWMPRAFARLGTVDGERVYLPLNRRLRPLGMLCRRGRWRGHAAALAVVFRTDPVEFDGIWYDPPAGAPAPDRPSRRRLVLYDDTAESRMDYFARFERLMARASRLHPAPPEVPVDRSAAGRAASPDPIGHCTATRAWTGDGIPGRPRTDGGNLATKAGRPTRERAMSETERDLDQRVRERAYHLWERAGRPEGRSDDFWQQARQEVERERTADDERVDEEARESFPASDPPSHTGLTGEGRRRSFER